MFDLTKPVKEEFNKIQKEHAKKVLKELKLEKPFDLTKPVTEEFNKIQKENAKKVLKELKLEKPTNCEGSITDDFGIPEPDEEYILCNEAIWKKYLANRKKINK